MLQVPKTGKSKKKALPVNKDRFISKMFLRGDSVIIVLRNPEWVDNFAMLLSSLFVKYSKHRFVRDHSWPIISYVDGWVF